MAFAPENRKILSEQGMTMNGSKANGTESKHARTIYYGTFLQLPRAPDTPATPNSPPKYQLVVNHGALWVSTADGRIEGCDWDVKDEKGLSELLERNGWTLDGEKPSEGSVRIVRSRSGRNGFFFPGFVGTFVSTP